MPVTRPDDQLKRMLEQTLIPPTSVVELDPDTIDATTSRLASQRGSLAESYQLNSQHTRATLSRLPDAAARSTIRTFYFETTLTAFTQLHEKGTRWTLHASALPERVQALLSPLWTDPAVVDALYSVDVHALIDGTVWRSVPGAPGFLREKDWTAVQQAELEAAVPGRDLTATDGVLFVVGHLTRASYLSGDRAVRSVGLTAGVVTGGLLRAGADPLSGIDVGIIDAFIDAPVNHALGCDGVERALAAILTLHARPATSGTGVADTSEAADPADAAAPNPADPTAPASGPSAEALDLATRWDALSARARAGVEEMLQSAEEVDASGRTADLGRLTHRLFERSVQEFFSTERQSTQLPARLVVHTSPAVDGIPLPDVEPDGEAGLADVLRARRSVRSYERGPLGLDSLARLVRMAAGATGREDGYGVRGLPKFPYPSIGGLDSNELGVIVNAVEGMEPGYYVYDKVGHALVRRIRGDLRLPLVSATFESEWLFYAPVVFVLVNDQAKVAWKYKTRGYRISHLDQGALMQNLSLAATAHGLGSCPVAGYFDEVLARVLGYEGTDAFIASLVAVGRPTRLGHGG